jgi:hypothetical protein
MVIFGCYFAFEGETLFDGHKKVVIYRGLGVTLLLYGLQTLIRQWAAALSSLFFFLGSIDRNEE